MKIQKFDPQGFAYGVPCQGLFPWSGVAATPFGAMWCVVPPGQTIKPHRHHEGETYIVAQGRGVMAVGGERIEVGPGDAIFVDPFDLHALENPAAEGDLLFLAVYWEDMPLALASGEERAATRAGAAAPRRVWITATPPTPNGDLHVGHLSGPYLGADIYKRYLGMRGIEALYLTGADDHQSYVPLKGHRTGESPRQVADHFADEIEATFKEARIAVDHFARPKASPHHLPQVQELFTALWEKGALVAREAPTLWCESCRKYLFEAHVSGGCPHCGAGSDGNACEQCGWPNDCVNLVDPLCKYCGGPPTTRAVRRLYFPLAPYAADLKRFYGEVKMSDHLRTLCVQMLAKGLPEIAVSHPADWGIPVPFPGFEGQSIYVWLEMAPGFLAATQELLDRRGGGSWREGWQAEDQKLVQFFGFDNGYFHAVLFPALFLAYDPGIRLARAFVTNEFLRLDGAKFSTSRGHAIWGKELLARVPADVARFYLAWSGPEREQTNFTLAAMDETVARELVGGWQAWLGELGVKVGEEFGGIAPASGAWTENHEDFFLSLTQLAAEVGKAYEAESFSPQRAVRLLSELVRQARRFGEGEKHWGRFEAGREEWRNAIALELAAARALALLAAPVLPDFSLRLWQALGHPLDPTELAGPLTWETIPQFLPGGQRVSGLAGFEVTAGLAGSVEPVTAGREAVLA
ncbi:MAG: methionyl-tRNA synthetase [Acidobacteriota bacterium]|jgi:methionyl-tRNA synthetase|nr:methionyl-tRNA synthetase [Acidobacteriota bacterium]